MELIRDRGGKAERATLTIPEAAEVLGISRNHAFELARQGKLPNLRLGRRVVVPRVALDRFIEGAAVSDRDGS